MQTYLKCEIKVDEKIKHVVHVNFNTLQIEMANGWIKSHLSVWIKHYRRTSLQKNQSVPQESSFPTLPWEIIIK